MANFSVATESLTAASVLVAGAGQDVDGAQGSLQGTAGAADGTPAMMGYATFTGAAATALEGLHTAALDLSRALNTAAFAYQAADSAAAASLRVQG